MKLGRFREKDPEEEMRIEKENQAKEEEEKALAESIKVGDRCVLSDVVHIITTQPNVKSTKLVFSPDFFILPFSFCDPHLPHEKYESLHNRVFF